MTTLIIYAGPGGIAPSTKANYEKALEGLDGTYEWMTVKGPAGGTSFGQEVARHRGADGRLLPHYIKQASRPVGRVVLIVFSAGYGFAREMFKSGDDVRAVDAFLAVDAIHASIKGSPAGAAAAYRHVGKLRDAHPGDPRSYIPAEQMEGFVSFCRRAVKEEAFACIISSEIRPYYASTRETSNYITLSLDIEERAGDYSTFWQSGSGKQAHIHACNVTGPQMVSERLVPWLNEHSRAPITSPDKPPEREHDGVPPWQDPALTLGQRTVMFAQAEMDANVAETRPNWSPRIEEYFIGNGNIPGVIRNGKPLGIKSGNWCVAGSTFATYSALLPGESTSVIRRASGIEIQADAIKNGTWRPASLWFSGLWEPQVGDHVIYNRGATSGPQAWWRHGAIICQVSDSTKIYMDINANNGNKWMLKRRNAYVGGGVKGSGFKTPMQANPDLLGFVEITNDKHREVSDLFDITQGVGAGVDLSVAASTEEAIEKLEDLIEKLHKQGKLTSG